MGATVGQLAGDTAEQPAAVPRRPLVWVFLSVAAGVGFDRFAPLGSVAWGLAVAAAAWGGWLLLYRRRLSLSAALALLVCAAALGSAWHHVGWHVRDDDDISRFARSHSEPVALLGRAITAPTKIPAPPYDPMRSIPAEDMARLIVEVEAIRDRQQWRSASGRTSVSVAGHLLGVRPGNRLLIFGQMAAETPPANPGEHDFSADARRDGRGARVRCESPDCVTRTAATSAATAPSVGITARFQDNLTDLRRRGSEMLWRYLSHEQAGLAAAILLGDRDELPREQMDAYVETGTVHLLAVSGQQVSILAAGLFLGLQLGWLRRRWGLALVAVLTIIYALMTNAEPPVVRAAILVVTFCIALASSRRMDSMNVLAAAGLVVLALNPADLFRVGPQLSFLAVATLIWFARWQRREASSALDRLIASARPWPERVLRWCGDWFWRLTLAGVAVSLVAMPLTMFNFHLISPAGVLLTPVMMLPMAMALLSGLGILLFGWLAPPFAMLLAWICDGSLAAMNWAVDVGHSLPGSHFWVADPPQWWLAGFYAALAAAVCWPSCVPPRRWCAALLAGWITLGLGIGWWSGRDDSLRVTFLSVGHGAAVVMELPDGRTLLYDAGRMGSPHPAARAVGGYLWSRGRTHIDAVVLSHADADHYNAIPRLLKQFSIGAIYMSPEMLANDSHGVQALKQAIAEAGSGQGGPVQIDVLHPPQRGLLTPDPDRSDNAHSIVLAVQYAGHRLLLPGDLESPGMDDLIAEEPWDTDVLLAPHHGSPRSDPPGFSAWCRPEWTIVSGGEGEAVESEAIRAAYQQTGRRLLNTANDGAVQVVLGERGIEIYTWLAPKSSSPNLGFQAVIKDSN